MVLFRAIWDLLQEGKNEVANHPYDGAIGPDDREAAAFLLSVGFQEATLETAILPKTTFEHVHSSARDDALDPLSYRAWKNLEQDVPVLGYTKDWDRCERLRRALLVRFVHSGWPREEFLDCVNRPATLRSILYSCRAVPEGEEFMRELASDVLNGVLPATEPQKTVFQRSFRRNWRGDLKFDL